MAYIALVLIATGIIAGLSYMMSVSFVRGLIVTLIFLVYLVGITFLLAILNEYLKPVTNIGETLLGQLIMLFGAGFGTRITIGKYKERINSIEKRLFSLFSSHSS